PAETAAPFVTSKLNLPPPSAPELPPAKRAKKEINLQHLLQQQGSQLEFDVKSKLPPNFFDSTEHANEPQSEQPPSSASMGLFAKLPPPKNAAKKSNISASATYRNARPLHQPEGVKMAAAMPSPSPSVSVGAMATPPPSEEQPRGAVAEEAAGSSTLPRPSLLPRVRTDMYTAEDTVHATPSQPEMSLAYDQPAGPALPHADAADELLADVSEERILQINQDELKRHSARTNTRTRLLLLAYDFALASHLSASRLF
ncbi:MAG: hypothetical protein SGPRY_012704, partial [Prymnesium sp.]